MLVQSMEKSTARLGQSIKHAIVGGTKVTIVFHVLQPCHTLAGAKVTIVFHPCHCLC